MPNDINLRIKELKEKVLYEDIDITSVEEGEDTLVISGYANKFKDVTGEIVKDRDDEAVVPTGINLSNYFKNPIVLLNHDYGCPIGKATLVKVTDEGLLVTVEIYKSLNQEVYSAIKLGVLKAFSVGIRINDLTYDETKDLFFLTETELYEVSVVSVPANQESLITSVEEKLTIMGKSVTPSSLSEIDTLKSEVERLHSIVSELVSTKEVEQTDNEVGVKKDEGALEGDDVSLLDKVNSIEVSDETFDELYQVQELLNARLNTFLNNVLN